jgi:hypothetical protein
MRRHRHNLKPEQQFRLMAYLAERPALELIYRFKTAPLLFAAEETQKQTAMPKADSARSSSCANPG